MSGERYIIFYNGQPTRDKFGAVLLHKDRASAVVAADVLEGDDIRLMPAVNVPVTVESPRRGRPRKQQETGE